MNKIQLEQKHAFVSQASQYRLMRLLMYIGSLEGDQLVKKLHKLSPSLVTALAKTKKHASIFNQLYLPLCLQLHAQLIQKNAPIVVGISGAQGTGKSTISFLLEYLLEAGLGLSVLRLSLDDFYLQQAERRRLSEESHSLFQTRGVPGTHDITLLKEVITLAESVSAQRVVTLPSFDKSSDDQSTTSRSILLPVDIILLEGWCVAVEAQDEMELAQPINTLEKDEDQDGKWRRAVNDALKKTYQDVFNKIDTLVYLKPQNFETIFEQRWTQEQNIPEEKRMTAAELLRFIAHYERLTRHSFQTTAKQADVCLELGDDWSIREIIFRPAQVQICE